MRQIHNIVKQIKKTLGGQNYDTNDENKQLDSCSIQ